MPAQEVVPKIGGNLPGIVGGAEVVAAGAASDGQHDFDAFGLARLDLGAQVCAGIGVRITMASKIDHGSLAIAKCWKESKVYEVVVSGGASLRQGAFVAVLAPVD